MMLRRFSCILFSFAMAAISPSCISMPASAQLAFAPPGTIGAPGTKAVFQGDGSGSLQVLSKDGKRLECPLKHTDVHASVSGYIARVTVKQLFTNPFKSKIEAVYTFPLSESGAVDDMLMKVGSRTIKGTIKKREEARQIYETARNAGHVASLLDQERTNIFTQSVANIEPGKDVEVTISYVDVLPYSAGNYTFAFPTVVGPRFNPGTPAGRTGMGFSPDTAAVPDASKITPHVAPEGVRAGHDISISVALNAGLPIGRINSQLHDVKVNRAGNSQATISLVNKNTIPNKDFVLSWGVSADSLKTGYLTNAKDGKGFFTMMVMPPKKPTSAQIQPKEMIFLIDCSGSQRGLPLQKAKEAMVYALDHMNDNDTFQVMAFNSGVTKLFEQPRPANAEMRRTAKSFVESLEARGGTWMAPAVEAACKEPTDANRLRIVSFMTDGYVGNDYEVIGLVKKLRGTSRWFPFGTGNSVNRMLIDGIAKEGGGEADYVYLNSDAAAVGKKFYDKIATPVLTDVKVDYNGLEVKEVFPYAISDVWERKPLYITGRYNKPGAATVTISGFSGGKPYTEKLDVNLPANNDKNDVLGSIWARAKVDRLMSEDYMGAQQGSVKQELKEEIERVALEHHIMSQYTSFVAVEEQTVTKGGVPTKIEVPVELPDGVSREGIFGEKKQMDGRVRHARALQSSSHNELALSWATSRAPARQAYSASLQGATNGTIGPSSMAMPMSTPVARSVGAAVHAPASAGAHYASPMKASLGTGGRGYYKAARKLEIADELSSVEHVRPIRSDADRKAALGKLSVQLQKLVDAKLDSSATSFGEIKIERGRIYVKLTLATGSKLERYTLLQAGFQLEELVFSENAACGWVSIQQLLDLASHAQVINIELALKK